MRDDEIRDIIVGAYTPPWDESVPQKSTNLISEISSALQWGVLDAMVFCREVLIRAGLKREVKQLDDVMLNSPKGVIEEADKATFSDDMKYLGEEVISETASELQKVLSTYKSKKELLQFCLDLIDDVNAHTETDMLRGKWGLNTNSDKWMTGLGDKFEKKSAKESFILKWKETNGDKLDQKEKSFNCCEKRDEFLDELLEKENFVEVVELVEPETIEKEELPEVGIMQTDAGQDALNMVTARDAEFDEYVENYTKMINLGESISKVIEMIYQDGYTDGSGSEDRIAVEPDYISSRKRLFKNTGHFHEAINKIYEEGFEDGSNDTE
ncbi:MAG: hypothetical protein WC783_02650 [Candidatus Paceibacterota bacterium]|jgi:hypothetical protein